MNRSTEVTMTDMLRQVEAIRCPVQPPGQRVFTYGITQRDYEECSEESIEIPSEWLREARKGDVVLALVTRASVLSTPLEDIISAAAIRLLLDLEELALVTADHRKEILNGVALAALKILRLAGNANKGPLEIKGSVNINPAAAINAYNAWITMTPNKIISLAIQDVRAGFPESAPIEARLAANRLIGRGWTSLTLICELFLGVTGEGAIKTLGRLTGAFTDEVQAFIATCTWISEENARYYFAFYTGVPEVVGAKHYKHLAAIAFRVLRGKSLEAYEGGLKHVQFPEKFLSLIEELRTQVADRTLPDDDEGWRNVMTAMATKAKSHFLAPCVPPKIVSRIESGEQED